MRNRSYSLWLVLGIAALCSSCTEEFPAAPRRDETRQTLRRYFGGKKPTFAIEASQMQYADSVPGFGGYFFDKKGNLEVFMLDTAKFGDVLHKFDRVLATYGQVPGATIKVRQATYSFLALMEWRHYLASNMGEHPDIVSVGIDKSANNVRVRVASEKGIQSVTELMQTYAIPKDAVDVIVAPTERDFTDYLYGAAPSAFFLAGLKIQGKWLGSNLGPCSLGFNTYSGGYFVTNSHCTGARGYEANPTTFYQPDANGTYIGYEVDDPDYFNDAANKDCDSAFNRCRYSDAALIEYSTYVAPGSAGQGLLYITTFASGILGDYGSLEIAGADTISDEASGTPQGITLHKIGAASGWTYGEVIATCEDVTASGYYYICQDQVAATAVAGDSGSPVFELLGSGKVKLYGIVRGGTSGYFTFTPLSAIWSELGYLPSTH